MATRIVAPLTGSVTVGSWVAKDISVANVTLPSGKLVHFEYLLPAQYSTNFIYPIMLWLHPDFEGDGWYNGSNTNPNSVSGADANGFYNTSFFRTNYPSICIVGYADQTNAGVGDGNDAVENWGGWVNNGSVGSGTNASGDTGPNTFAIIGVVQWVLANLSADPNRVYVNGFSLGGIGAQYLMLKYNQVNGNPAIFTSGSSTGGVLEINGFGAGPTAADQSTMTNVPVWWVSGGQDTTSVPAHWNEPLWTKITGNAAYPAPGGTAAQAQAGSTQYHYWEDPNIGHQQTDSSGNPYPINTTILNYLYAQIGSTTPTPPPPPPPPPPPGTTTRDWFTNPGQDGMFWNLPFQTTAQWTTTGPLITILHQGSGHVHLPGDFSIPFVIGKSTDPTVTIHDASGQHADIQIHMPLGTVQELPITGTDNGLGACDRTKPYALYTMNTATMNTNGVAASGTVITANHIAIDDACGPIMMDAVTQQPGTGNAFGAIQDYELTAANADPNYVIQHMLAYEMDPSQLNSGTAIWPLFIIDTSFPNTGGLNQGYTVGIPANVPMPANLTRGGKLLWNVFQQFGAVFYNVSGNGTISIDCYWSTPANQALANDIAASFSAIVPNLALLANQTGLSSMKGMVNGVRSDAFPAPPILDLSPSGGVEVAPSSMGAFFPSGYNVTPTAPVQPAALTINTPTQQTTSASFAVSGTITGYAAAPTLNYRDDAGSWLVLPVNFSVTATSFSFTHPGMTAGSHTISVRDANNISVAVSTGTFSVVTGATPVITVTAPSLPAPFDAFTLSGGLQNYAAAPALTYTDDSGVATTLPAGSTVTTTAFSFLHPALAAGAHTTVISDGSNRGSVSYSVTVIPGGASLNPTTITPGTGFIIDNSSNRWTVTVGGQVAVNGIVDATTANVIEMAWVKPLVWQENSSNIWWSKTSPTAAWSPPTGTTTSPLANLPTITINPIANPTPNVAFTVTGSLANETTVPSLTYTDNQGTAQAFPAGSTVTTTTFSFVHPAMPTGSDTLVVSDGSFQGTASYTVATAGWTNLPSTTNLNNTITGLAASTAYDIEVFATNSIGQGPPSAILTVTTNAPAVIVPGAPTGLTSTATAQTSVTLAWTPPATGTAPFTYTPQWSVHNANSWTNGPTVSTVSAQITGLTAGTSYDFQVEAINSAGTGPFSTIYTVSTAAAPPPTVTWNPAAEGGIITLTNSNLTATAGGSTTAYGQHSVVLSTTSLASGKASFEVTMSALTQNCAVGLVTATYPLTDLLGADLESVAFYMSTGTGSQAAQTIYINNIAVLSPSGNAPAADTAGAVFTFCVDITNKLLWVTGPSMRATYGASAWNDSPNASPANGTGGVSFAQLTGGALSIVFSTDEGGGVAVLNAGSSPFVRASSIPSTFPAWNGTQAVVVAPGAVTGLVAGTPSNTSVPLTWTAPATGTPPFTYAITQALHLGTFTQVGTSSSTSFTATGLAATTSYDFIVTASNSAGSGGNSNTATVTTAATLPVPGAPSGLSAGAPTNTSVPLTWQPSTTGGAPTSYQVQYKLTTSSTWINFSPTVPA